MKLPHFPFIFIKWAHCSHFPFHRVSFPSLCFIKYEPDHKSFIKSCYSRYQTHWNLKCCWCMWKRSCNLRHVCRESTAAAVEHCDPLVGRKKGPGLFSDGVILLHDNAQPHTDQQTWNLLWIFGCKTLYHPPFSLDMAPSTCDLFHTFWDPQPYWSALSDMLCRDNHLTFKNLAPWPKMVFATGWRCACL